MRTKAAEDVGGLGQTETKSISTTLTLILFPWRSVIGRSLSRLCQLFGFECCLSQDVRENSDELQRG